MKKMKLHQVPLGCCVYIDEILAEKDEKRRLMDLGMTENAMITPVLISPAGDPVAYEVRQLVVVLRNCFVFYIVVKGVPK